MSFLLPGFLLAAGAIAAGAVLLHFIVTREPDQLELPTARFAPERTIQARARRFEPRDLLLLLVRVALLLAVGAALAGPVISPPRREVVRIVMLDRSRAVASPGEAADSARALLRDGDPLILFDSSATLLERNISDSLAGLAGTTVAGRISTALITALRTASRIRDRADSIELVLVSPLAGEEVDAATDSIRGRWPAGIRLVAVASRAAPPASPATLESESGDPLGMALPPLARNGSPGTVRVLRRLASSVDSSWANQPGRVLVVWPPNFEVPPGWAAGTPDTAGAVIAGDVVVVAPFVRQVIARPRSGRGDPGGIASGPSGPRNDLVLARWVDGEPAALETPLGQGCIRTVTINVPTAGDLVLDPRFGRLVSVLTQPCGGARDWSPLEPDRRARLAGPERGLRTAAAAIAPAERMATPWSRWLLVAALLLVGLEAAARRRAAG
ncbi:MAG TPA: BatA domain-containing protein [Gemmatimonadales bacterium]|nr:BatA domain-containing protein [Gemmatimonadales bacterium]